MKQLRRTIGLLSSMIYSGESHTDSSERSVRNSLSALDSIESKIGKDLNLDELVRMKSEGMSIVAIAKHFGVSRQTIYRHLERIPKESETLPVDGQLKSELKFSETKKEHYEGQREKLDEAINNDGHLYDSTDIESKIVPKGKGKRLAPNVYQYENCFTYKRVIPGKETTEIPFKKKEDAIAASK